MLLKKYIFALTALFFLAINIINGQPGSKEIKRLYKDYMAEIIFSENVIDLTNFNEAELKSEFDLSDELYFRFFMDQTLADYYASQEFDQNFSDEKFEYNYAYRVYVNGDLQATWLFKLDEEGYYQNITLGAVLSTTDKDEKRKYSELVNPWVDMVATMNTGENAVKIEMVPMNELIAGQEVSVLAKGEFKLNVEQDKMDEFVETHTTSLPEPTVIAQKIENEILEVSADAFENSRPFRVIITDYNGDWRYKTDDDGFITHRYITASVVYDFLEIEQCWVKSIIFTQEHQGKGEFGPIFYDRLAEGYYDYQIPCSKAAKQDE